MSEDRLSALEKRVSKLENDLSILSKQTTTSSNRSCKKCGSTEVRLKDSSPHPHFGTFGDTMDTYACDECGFEQTILQKNR